MPSARLRIDEMSIGSLKGADRKLRRHDKRQMELLEQSLRTFGFVAPILVNANSVILDGHALVEATRGIGMAEVPVVRVEHLDDARERALRIALNRLPELATWDREALGLEFTELFEMSLDVDLGFSFDVTGFSSPERDALIEATRVANDDEVDAAIEEDAMGPSVSRLGDLWALGEHRIICGNARVTATYEALLGDERAFMAFNDPPYDLAARFISKKHEAFVEGSGELGENFTAFLTEYLAASKPFMVPGAVAFCFMDWRHMKEMLGAGEGAGLDLVNLIVWDKGHGYMGGLYRSQHELIFAFRVPGGTPINNVQLGRRGRNKSNASRRREVAPRPKPSLNEYLPMALCSNSKQEHSHALSFSGFSGSLCRSSS
jgi:hypothetical protein